MDPSIEPEPRKRLRIASPKMRRLVAAVFLGSLLLVAALLLYVLRLDDRMDALIVSSREAAARGQTFKILDACQGRLSLESANRELQVWQVPSRRIDDCIARLSRLADRGVAAEARVNWLCYPAKKRRNWLSSLWNAPETPVLSCPDANAQFNYLTGLPLRLAELAPPSAARMPVIEAHRTVLLPDPLTQEPIPAPITGVSVAPDAGFQIWFDLPDGGRGTLLRHRDSTVGEIEVESGSYSLRPNVDAQGVVQPGFVWLPAKPDDPAVPLHSESASAGANLTLSLDPFLARSFNNAIARSAQEREAQSLFQTEYGDASRDPDGTVFLESCPADPQLPAGLTMNKPIELRVLFAYTQAARDELAGKVSESAAREQIKKILDTRLGTINETFLAQGVPLQLIRADSTPIRGLEAVLPKIKIAQVPGKPEVTWVDVVAKDLMLSRERCTLAAERCPFQADPQDPASGVSTEIRKLAYDALEPAFVTERRRAKADVVAFLVGEDQLGNKGQAANIRASFYASFLVVRASALGSNTLEHEIGHLLGVRHQRCLDCVKSPACSMTLDSAARQCLCQVAQDCAGEWEADQRDERQRAPRDNHALTFVAKLNSGQPGPNDTHVMLATVGSDYPHRLNTKMRKLRLPRWSTDSTSAQPWEPPDYPAPRPFLLSNASSTEKSNEARVITAYAACAARFISSPEDGFTVAAIADPTWTPIAPDDSPYDAPLTSQPLADPASSIKQVRDAQRTIYFDTGYPLRGASHLLKEGANALDELLLQLSIEAATDGNPTTNAVTRTFFIEGHADRVGKEQDNCALARRRAHATALALCARMPEAEVGVTSYGELWPTVLTGDDTEEYRNRRTVISWPDFPLTRGGKPIAVESCRSFIKSYKDRSQSCEASSPNLVNHVGTSHGTGTLGVSRTR